MLAQRLLGRVDRTLEIAALFGELCALADSVDVEAQSLARLAEFVDPEASLLLDGQRELGVRKGGCLALALVPLAALAALWLALGPS